MSTDAHEPPRARKQQTAPHYAHGVALALTWLALAHLLAMVTAVPAGAQVPTPPPSAGVAPDIAPDGPVIQVSRLTGPITLDGRVDEAAWEAVTPLPVVMHLPSFGGPPSERTEFRLTYDDDYIYFSCRNYDSDPAGIQAPTLRRDASNLTNDWCVLQLDTFNDEETGVAFGTTPAGIRTDVVWPGDGNAPGNFTWNTFWDAAVHRDDEGWYAEIRVPLSSLRFQERGDGAVVMGMSAWRSIARKNEFVVFPAIDNRWGGFAVVKASQYRDVAFDGIRATRPVYVTPYAAASAGRYSELHADGLRYQSADQSSFDVGGDIKYALASNLTLDVTFNTDFAQAEADNQQVNLTRFSLFFPEKRLFFQERGEIFGFSVGGNERLFHSRRVGLVAGDPVPILAGARLVGRLGEWDVGFLNMQTGSTSLSPSENLGVLRLRRRVLNANSYVGGIVTSRFAEAGAGHNVLYGLDGLIRVFGEDYLTVNWSQSFADDDSAPAGPAAAPTPGPRPYDRALTRLYWERRGSDGLTYDLELARVGDTFEPGLGFLFRRDYSKAALGTGYGWRPTESSPLLRYGLRFDGTVFTRNADRSVETVELATEANLALKAGHEFTLAGISTYEDLQTGFDLADEVFVPAGGHQFVAARLSYTPPVGSLLRSSASIQAGQFYDGRILSASVSPVWFASRHFELGGSYEVSRLSFPARNQSLTAQVARIRTEIMLSPQVSSAAFVQYNSAAERVSGNIRVRYNPSEGHDLYVVWNEQILSDRFAHHPVPPLSESRALIIKYARTATF